VRFRVYLLTVKVVGKEKKDGFEKHRNNIREQGIGFLKIGYLRNKKKSYKLFDTLPPRTHSIFN